VADARAWEATLGDVLREVSGIDVPAEASFFEAGVTSADLITVHRRLCEATGRELNVKVFFKYPTRRSLAGHLAAPDEAARDEPSPDVPAPTAPSAGWSADARRALRARLQQRNR
jgi:hypothetical protein